ncbi:exopolysaccharide biosynthesis polyprenyl glycosylphosphotransferase [Amaricoccus solimangrovi]|uniref:Exopolysaccharide biosynthesis polyprenyl glycosylphosphotransferase n=2 Tax=Amaricoccus solimangrovi TaxID=2589815 RepID=A0A501WYE0_9RHOB|nr:exopolysaccharide biosynthesis polyprenyl glycosylphosphotransferase [Amaricoccus solimangrovi]
MSAAARGVARTLRRASLSPAEPALIAAGLDFAAVTLALSIAVLLERPGAFAPGDAFGAAGQGLAVVCLVRAARGYRLAALRRFGRGLGLLWLAALLAWGAGRAFGLGPARPWALLALPPLLGAPARALSAVLSGWVRDFGLTERRAVIVGGGPEAERLIAGLAANPDNDIRVCGLFDDRADGRAAPVIAGIPRLGTTRELLAFARAAEIDMLIIALPLAATARIREILAPLSVLPLDIRLSTYSADMEFRRGAGDGLRALGARPLGDRGAILKRAVDLLGASLALLLLAVPMALVALAIRLESRGPALFRQPRHGFNHRPIPVWKFRSMYAEACDPAARRIVTRDDPRVTRVGRFIRKYSIDELPQLFNVLRGELSLVGPRPHAVVALTSQQIAFAEIVDGYAARHRMRPGMTGWAQIEGWRGEVDDPEKLRRRFEHDLYYIENWSLGFDLRILLLTPFRLLNQRGAY